LLYRHFLSSQEETEVVGGVARRLSAISNSTLKSMALSTPRNTAAADEEALVELGLSTGLFSAEEADALLRSSLHGVHNGTVDAATHVARTIDNVDGTPAGWTYLSVDTGGAEGVWELWWIGVAPSVSRQGVGSALLKDAEGVAKGAGARMLLISTSSSEATAGARSFYAQRGYKEVGRIPAYYGPGDDKVILWKEL
jgi:ribosomal protein S18 acetylase RimI-like enzyme